MQWLPPAGTTGAVSLLVPYTDLRDFPSGAAGPMMACVPVGMIIGDVIVARLLAPEVRQRLMVPLIALLGLPLLGFALDIGPMVAAGLLFLVGVGYTYGLGLQRRFLDLVPDGRRGQALALLSTGLMTLQGVGPVVIGGLAEVIPAGWAMAVAGATTLVIAGWYGVRGYRGLAEFR